ncbi:MAG: hypothetical protein JNM93_01750 [Bacteriovoracaceae bacterium]|nr:hypothetical protein [Bacteriovoracaceae bacterium]
MHAKTQNGGVEKEREELIKLLREMIKEDPSILKDALKSEWHDLKARANISNPLEINNWPELDEYVRKNPWKTVLGASLFSFLIALFFSRRSN